MRLRPRYASKTILWVSAVKQSAGRSDGAGRRSSHATRTSTQKPRDCNTQGPPSRERQRIPGKSRPFALECEMTTQNSSPLMSLRTISRALSGVNWGTMWPAAVWVT